MSFFLGVKSIAKAFKMLIKHPSLLLLSALVGAVACTISVCTIWYILENGDRLSAFMISSLGLETKIAADSFARTLIDYLLKSLGVLSAILLLPWVVALIGFPICTPLADRTDILLGGEETDIDFWQSIRTSLRLNLSITMIGGSIGITLYLLTWIPVIGLLFSFVSAFVWTPLVMCLNVYENSLSRRGLSFREMCSFITKKPLSSIMVGGQTMLLISIPFLNIFGLPLAIIAGVIAVRDRELSP